MYPVLFQKGIITIYSYGLMFSIAGLVVLFFAVKEAKHKNIKPSIIYDVFFWSMISGIAGARLCYILLDLKYFLYNPKEIIMLNHGGLVFYGGVFFALIVVGSVVKRKQTNFREILNVFIPYIPLGHAIGRIGCLLNGCCYGKVTNLFFAVNIAGEDRHPTQIYEVLLNLFIFVVLIFMRKKEKYQQKLVYIYILLYGIGRFIIEYFRGDPVTVFYSLRISQWISIVGVLVSILFLLKPFRKNID
jgi:phosphatidylglycerol---prolipoprotein diacylglyceryl transferase